MSKNKEPMNSSVDLRTHHTRGKKSKLVIRGCMTKKILALKIIVVSRNVLNAAFIMSAIH